MIDVNVESIPTSSFKIGSFEFEIASNCDDYQCKHGNELAVEFNCKLIPNSQFFITLVVAKNNMQHLELQMTYPSETEESTATHEVVTVKNYQQLTDCVQKITKILMRVYGKQHAQLMNYESPHMVIINTLFFENIGFRGIGNEPD